MSKELEKAVLALGKMQVEYAKATNDQISGIKDAIIYLAASIAIQKSIDAQRLLKDFSEIVERNHGGDEVVPVAVLDVRAILVQATQ
jgi:hypothetical protein